MQKSQFYTLLSLFSYCLFVWTPSLPAADKDEFPTYSWENQHWAICQNALSLEPFVGNVVTNDVTHLPEIYPWAKETKSPLVLVDRTGKLDQALVALAGHPRAITIAYAVASDMDSLNSIHLGENISASSFMASRGYASAFAEWEKQYTNVKFENLAPDRRTEKADEAHPSQSTTLKDRLLRTIRTMESDDLLVILAHNVHGELRFGDGSSCQVTEVTAGKGKIWVLSCGTFEYVSRDTELSLGTTDLLTYSDAVAAVRRTLGSANRESAKKSGVGRSA